jgi:hypothetical protein
VWSLPDPEYLMRGALILLGARGRPGLLLPLSRSLARSKDARSASIRHQLPRRLYARAGRGQPRPRAARLAPLACRHDAGTLLAGGGVDQLARGSSVRGLVECCDDTLAISHGRLQLAHARTFHVLYWANIMQRSTTLTRSAICIPIGA